MSYAIGAAGTGGHVYPALAVAEALVGAGVRRSELLFIGGDRLEKEVFPSRDFPYVEVELRGLQRRVTLENLSLPALVVRARRRVEAVCRERGVKVALGMGSYVTIPLGWAALRLGVPYFVQEQNAVPGLANRVMARRAEAAFTSFAGTRLPRAVHTGNPVRAELAGFSRAALRETAGARYDLKAGRFTLGIVGGSLGAMVLNRAALALAEAWVGPPIQLLHICGPAHVSAMSEAAEGSSLRWRVLGFEASMEHFFAAADLVVARGGGMVAELAATATPAILVPGGFGSAGHQDANAVEAQQAGAVLVLPETHLGELPGLVRSLIADPARLRVMSDAARGLAKPDAAVRIATILKGRHG